MWGPNHGSKCGSHPPRCGGGKTRRFQNKGFLAFLAILALLTNFGENWGVCWCHLKGETAPPYPTGGPASVAEVLVCTSLTAFKQSLASVGLMGHVGGQGSVVSPFTRVPANSPVFSKIGQTCQNRQKGQKSLILEPSQPHTHLGPYLRSGPASAGFPLRPSGGGTALRAVVWAPHPLSECEVEKIVSF